MSTTYLTALCCECGTTRVASTYGVRSGDDSRDIVRRKCATCDKVTRHALVTDAGEAAGDSATTEDKYVPFWQTEPCPDWCTRGHRDEEWGLDRVHDGLNQGRWTLSTGHALEGTNRSDGRKVGDAPYVSMCVRQDARRGAEPNIALQIGSGDWWHCVELTPWLAAKIMVRLRELLDVVDPDD